MLYPVKQISHANFQWEATTFTSIDQILQKNFFDLSNGMCREISKYAIDNPEESGLFTIRNRSNEIICQAFFSVDTEAETLIFDEIPKYSNEDFHIEIITSLSEFISVIRSSFPLIKKVIALKDVSTYDFDNFLPLDGRDILLWKRDSIVLDIFELYRVIQKPIESKMCTFDDICIFRNKEVQLDGENDYRLKSDRFLNEYVQVSGFLYRDNQSGIEVSCFEVPELGYYHLKDGNSVILKKGAFILRYPDRDISFSSREFLEKFYLKNHSFPFGLSLGHILHSSYLVKNIGELIDFFEDGLISLNDNNCLDSDVIPEKGLNKLVVNKNTINLNIF